MVAIILKNRLLNFFEYLSSPRLINARFIVVKNAIWLGFSQGITGIANFFIVVYVTRSFGATLYGKFSFAFAFVMIFSTLFDFGLNTSFTRENAGKDDGDSHLLHVVILKILLGLLSAMIIGFFAYFAVADHSTYLAILVFLLYLIAFEGNNLIYAFFRARQQMEIESLLRIFQITFLVALIFVFLNSHPSPAFLAFIYGLSVITTWLIAFSVLVVTKHVKLNNFSFRNIFPIWEHFLAIGFYIALAKGVGDITMYIDSIILGFNGLIKETAWYNAAIRINGLILFPMAVLASTIFPNMLVVFKKSSDEFSRYCSILVKSAINVVIPIGFIVFNLADFIIKYAYNIEFMPAVGVLRIIVFMAVLVYIHAIYYHILLCFNLQKRYFYIMLFAAGTSILFNFALIPFFRMYGAAISLLVTHFLILALNIFFIKRNTYIHPLKDGHIGAFFISFLLCLAISIFLNLINIIALGVSVWLLAFILAYILLLFSLYYFYDLYFTLILR